MRYFWRPALATALSLSILACEKAPEPVGSVEARPDTIRLAYPGYSSLVLKWDMNEPLGSLEGEPFVFVHLLDGDGTVVRTFDHPLPFPWEAGSRREYEIALYQSALAPSLDPGAYRLTSGMYDASGRRWAFTAAGEEVAALEYEVATVEVEGDPAEVPMFYFSPSWLPLEAGTDVQVLGRRWLTAAGTIRVADITAPGTVWMRLTISPAEEGREELSLTEGASEPGAQVSSTCGGDAAVVSGYGSHDVEVRIQPVDEGGLPEECEISLTPDFQIVDNESLSRRSVGLEVLSWAGD